MDKTTIQINQILDEVRPGIQMDGGDVEVKSFKDGVLALKIKGACVGCPMAQATFNEGVGSMIQRKIKEVKKIRYE
ncbi:MAG: NifU family protein [Candidatus Kuenenbacteria bacterium]